jgi:hypothetical protein
VEDGADAREQVGVGQLDVVAAGGPGADLAGFVAVGVPEGGLFGGGVFEVGGEGRCRRDAGAPREECRVQISDFKGEAGGGIRNLMFQISKGEADSIYSDFKGDAEGIGNCRFKISNFKF